MHQEGKSAASNAAEDKRDQQAVLARVLDAHPATLRLSDLIRELTSDPEDFAERDRIERAVRDLVKGGLLFRCEGAVLPTRQAVYYEELS